jgi:hypothetical protein
MTDTTIRHAALAVPQFRNGSGPAMTARIWPFAAVNGDRFAGTGRSLGFLRVLGID